MYETVQRQVVEGVCERVKRYWDHNLPVLEEDTKMCGDNSVPKPSVYKTLDFIYRRSTLLITLRAFIIFFFLFSASTFAKIIIYKERKYLSEEPAHKIANAEPVRCGGLYTGCINDWWSLCIKLPLSMEIFIT